LAESPRPMSDTKKLASPFLLLIYRNLEFDPSYYQDRNFVLRRLIGPILYTLLLFKACLLANSFCAQYWP
jgi:hypothetical protein